MRWSGQLIVIAALAAAGAVGWHAHQTGRLAAVPVVGNIVARLTGPGETTARGRRDQGPPVVDVDTVKTGRIIETHEAVGTARAFESITVTAKVAGMIQDIKFQEGQKVQAGDVLLRLETDERRADIEAAVAEIRRAEAQRNELRTRLERALALRRTGSGTEAQVEDLTAQVKTLDSAIASAEARRKAAEARLDDTIARAPFPGRLGTRSVSLGAYVTPGTRITTLDDLSRIRLDFSVPENLVGHLKPGQVVRARSAAFGDRVFEGKVSLVDPRIDPVTRSVRLTAEFANQDETLRPGMFMSVTLEVAVKDKATVVPEEAVVSEGLRQLIYVVKDDKVERRVIVMGQRQGGQIEVIEGLSPGETIVVRGVQRVRAGATVRPRPLGSEGPPQAGPAAPRGAAENVAPPPRGGKPAGGAAAAERRG
ncbi:MAG TPA: efflux RND transporter periplasmic adaptor subunit [Beijerinckiaceae bacterium]|nr:efflux RND transporter periplasmic adaptor subunit [Beijerinckiaceae bacterium]